MEVREVTPTELWDEYKLLLGAADGFAYDIPVPNSEKGINALAYAMAQGLNFVSVEDDEITGAIVLVLDSLWWVDEFFLVDIAFYVGPTKRKSRAASMLIERAKEKSKELGLPLQISVTYGTDLDRKENFILRKGFTKIGGNYVMENSNG